MASDEAELILFSSREDLLLTERCFIMILCALLSLVAAAEGEAPMIVSTETPTEHIKTLTPSDFDNGLIKDAEQPWLVVFHYPRCSHCVRFKPVLAKLVASGMPDGFGVGEVNCMEHQPFCRAMRVLSVPTLLLFKDKAIYLYSGNRSFDGVVAFLEGGFARVKTHTTRWQTLGGAFGEAVQIVWEEVGDLVRHGPLAIKAMLGAFVLLFVGVIAAGVYIFFNSRRGVSKEKLA